MHALERLYGWLSIRGAAATGYERLGSVDLLRATAALSVLLSHAYAYPTFDDPGSITRTQYMIGLALSSGVFLFFAVSGYLIAGPFLKALARGSRMPPVRGYALRRSARILPAWWFALAAVILLTEPVIRLWQLGLHATLTFGPIAAERSRFLSIGWTLGIEALFYAFVPLGAYLVYRVTRGRPLGTNGVLAGLAGLWVLSAGWAVAAAVLDPLTGGQIGLWRGFAHFGFGLISGLYHFVPGMVVFVLLMDEDGLSRRVRGAVAWARERTFTLLFGAAVLWVVSVAASEPGQSELRGVLVGQVNALACGVILFAVLTGARKLRPVILVAAPIGLVSYGVYLWHGVMIDALSQAGVVFITESLGPLGLAVRAAVLLAVALVLGTLSWLLVERPLLRRTAGWERGAAKIREHPA